MLGIGKSVRLYLADGTVGGLRTAGIMNWTGHVSAVRRIDLGELLRRKESGRTGVYLLLGDDLAYVGEADVVRNRLRAHARPEPEGGKDFWTEAVIITSKDTNLTKAHARYLEARSTQQRCANRDERSCRRRRLPPHQIR
ncbi:MAG: GIY-YIG nuclease family protein [Bifidobacteriaceae bacterium]|jgi:hypothetical protein|nr:GIY-YIG nuclease family protein [Bifidobacteriaceae bacterium]